MAYLLCLVALWIVCALTSAMIAEYRAASVLAGFFVGFFLGPLGIVLALFLPRNEQQILARRINDGELRQCIRCREYIQYDALICRFCGQQYTKVP